MLTRESLRQKLSQLPTEISAAHIEKLEYFPDDFHSSSTEELVVLYRGEKSAFEDILGFWVETQKRMNLNGKEEFLFSCLESAECQPLSEQNFTNFLSFSQSLNKPFIINPNGKYVRGLQMSSDWDDVAIVGEFEQEYISYNWETTA